LRLSDPELMRWVRIDPDIGFRELLHCWQNLRC
jgi:hypothetical protein